LFWRLSLCQVMHVLDALSQGRRKTAGGKTYRKGNPADLLAMFGRYSNVGVHKVQVPPVSPEGAAVP
jgi:hypothetical protein